MIRVAAPRNLLAPSAQNPGTTTQISTHSYLGEVGEVRTEMHCLRTLLLWG